MCVFFKYDWVGNPHLFGSFSPDTYPFSFFLRHFFRIPTECLDGVCRRARCRGVVIPWTNGFYGSWLNNVAMLRIGHRNKLGATKYSIWGWTLRFQPNSGLGCWRWSHHEGAQGSNEGALFILQAFDFGFFHRIKMQFVSSIVNETSPSVVRFSGFDHLHPFCQQCGGKTKASKQSPSTASSPDSTLADWRNCQSWVLPGWKKVHVLWA